MGKIQKVNNQNKPIKNQEPIKQIGKLRSRTVTSKGISGLGAKIWGTIKSIFSNTKTKAAQADLSSKSFTAKTSQEVYPESIPSRINTLESKMEQIDPTDLEALISLKQEYNELKALQPQNQSIDFGKLYSIDDELRTFLKPFETKANEALNEPLDAAKDLSISLKEQRNGYIEYNKEVFLAYERAYNDLDPENTEEIRKDLSDKLSELKSNYQVKEKENFKEMKANAGKLIETYNQLDKNNPLYESSDLQELENQINAHNRESSLSEMTTSENSLFESAIAGFEGVFEKKMSILTELQENEEAELLGNLNEAPTTDKLKNVRNIIIGAEPDSAENLSAADAKEMVNEIRQSLEWGNSHIITGRSNPSVWTPINRISLKHSQGGKLHASVSSMTPITQEDGSMTPAGLRSKKGFDTHPANFHMTETYLLNPDGTPNQQSLTKTFRGGQFPTAEAAKEALGAIIKNSGSNDLHIASLLTPTALTVLKKDRKLLDTHRKNIKSALNSLAEENKGTDKGERIKKIQDNISLSNFGVNEGAVGLKKALGKKMIVGWHHATKNYNNAAMERNNERIINRLNELKDKDDLTDGDMKILRNLNALASAGQEMEKIWAQNDFAKGAVGNDQFKMAALQLTLTKLLGTPYYVHCMSGKDRTGTVESAAQSYYDEIMMNIVDDQETIDKSNRSERVDTTLKALGLEDGGPGLFQKKKIASKWLPDTVGISKNTPLANDPERKVKASKLPTFYDKTPTLLSKVRKGLDIDKSYETGLEKLHRQQVNKRLSLFNGSLTITQRNTGFAGFKIKGGESLKILASGFNRDYVLLKTMKSSHGVETFSRLANLDELDENDRHELEEKASSILENDALPEKKKIKELTNVLKQVEDLKFQTIQPQTKVSS